jgi:hypothetical protein
MKGGDMEIINTKEYFDGELTILNSIENVNYQIINDKNNTDANKLISIMSRIKKLKDVFNKRASEAISIRIAK